MTPTPTRVYRLAVLAGVLLLGPVLLGADAPASPVYGHAFVMPECRGCHGCDCSPCLCGPDCACSGDGDGNPFTLGRPRSPTAKVGGRLAPDGKTEIQIDLPGNLHRRNTASFGLGLCVFTSIHHSAVWQEVKLLQEFPKYLIDKRIPGGGYPQKVAQLISRKAKEAGVAEPDYIQVEGGDLEILKLACATGRMPGVTYSFSPTGRYGGGRIAHMVSLVHADEHYFTVLDNNYTGDTNYEWMSPTEFNKTYTGSGGGWSVILLAPGPAPAPHN